MKFKQINWWYSIVVFISFLLLLESCAVKRDCHGRIKHKHPNGFYI